jgi:capsular exopolysaccharide synthesis family protein
MYDRLKGERDGLLVVRALSRRWWLVLLIAIVAAGGAYEFAKHKSNQYTATSALLFVNSQLDQTLLHSTVITSSGDPSRDAATSQALLDLPTVAERVASDLHIGKGRVLSDISVGSDASSNVVPISATDRNPRVAANIANDYVSQYITFRQQTERSLLTGAQQLLQAELAATPSDQRNTSTYVSLVNENHDLQLLAKLQTGDAQQVQTAQVPTSPSSPSPTSDALIGLILGLLLGIVLVTLLERGDRRIKTLAEVEDIYGLPVLGTISETRDMRLGSPNMLDQEAFRMLYAQLRYFDVDRDIKRVMISSADAGEGKSTVALNLTRAALRAGQKRTLLIEADMHRPSLGRMLGLENMAGLSELLAHTQDPASALHELVVTPEDPETGQRAGFDVLLAGATPPNPAELLDSHRMTDLLTYASEVYDLVVIDTPPIGVMSDAIPLLHRVDGVILISRVGRSRRDSSTRLLKQLRTLNANVFGLVINGAQRSGNYYGYYGNYGPDPRRGRRRRPGSSDRSDRESVRMR